MDKVLAFLNSGFGLLLVGAAVGALGLFTWQRRDWVFKQAYLRTEVLLDRRLKLLEAINADAGALLAAADGVIAAVAKDVSVEQRNGLVELYNQQQAKWFGVAPVHAALLDVYFAPKTSAAFAKGLVEDSKALDYAVFQVVAGAITPDQAGGAAVVVRQSLGAWNTLAMQRLQPD